MDYTAIIKELCDAIYNNIQRMAEKFKFDRTFDAVVKEVRSKSKCVVNYMGRNFTVDYSSIVKVGDRVKICAPKNDWNQLYVVFNKTAPTMQTKNASGSFYFNEEEKKCCLLWHGSNEDWKLTADETGLSLDKIVSGRASNVWKK